MTPRDSSRPLPMEGIRVLDASSLFAGPLVATLFGDFGADVIKIEHPRGDPVRDIGYKSDGQSLWWKVIGRNKRSVTLNLSTKDGQELFKKLAATADVLIENFRPGTFERWGLGWEVLSEINPGLVMVRVTGFGQTGPYSKRPGFGTLAEAMSGFAHVTGQPDGPPTLPPFGLADGIAGLYGTFAAAFALFNRDVAGSRTGQIIDVSIYEPLFAILGYQPTLYDQLGVIQGRTGNRSVNNAPRNTYKTKDGRWVALSSAAPSIVRRVLELTGGQDVASDPRFQTAEDRLAHVEEIDGIVGGWIGRHSLVEVLEEFERVEAAIAPVNDIAQIFEDPQYIARRDIIEVDDPDLGKMKLQNVFPFLSDTPGRIDHTGPALGEHNEAVLGGELGLSGDELQALADAGVIRSSGEGKKG